MIQRQFFLPIDLVHRQQKLFEWNLVVRAHALYATILVSRDSETEIAERDCGARDGHKQTSYRCVWVEFQKALPKGKDEDHQATGCADFSGFNRMARPAERASRSRELAPG